MKGNLGGSRLAFSRKVNAALFGITFHAIGLIAGFSTVGKAGEDSSRRSTGFRY